VSLDSSTGAVAKKEKHLLLQVLFLKEVTCSDRKCPPSDLSIEGTGLVKWCAPYFLLCLVNHDDDFGFILICLNTHASTDRKCNHRENMAEINPKYNGNMGWNLVTDDV